MLAFKSVDCHLSILVETNEGISPASQLSSREGPTVSTHLSLSSMTKVCNEESPFELFRLQEQNQCSLPDSRERNPNNAQTGDLTQLQKQLALSLSESSIRAILKHSLIVNNHQDALEQSSITAVAMNEQYRSHLQCTDDGNFIIFSMPLSSLALSSLIDVLSDFVTIETSESLS
jgi:hypothetical protein